jgi:hypothetical protein
MEATCSILMTQRKQIVSGVIVCHGTGLRMNRMNGHNANGL